MAAVSVIVPFRGGGGLRDSVWAFLRARWAAEHPDWELVVGSPPDGMWRKALAVSGALTRATGDAIVVADADVWSDTVDQAVAKLADYPWCVPHRDVYRLTHDETGKVLAGASFSQEAAVTQTPYRGHPGGGIVVLRRDTIESIPMDPRFAGWGQEDDSWAIALLTLAGRPWRGLTPLWHLWHPPAERINRRIGNRPGEELYLRYLRARKNPTAMRTLLEEIDATEAA